MVTTAYRPTDMTLAEQLAAFKELGCRAGIRDFWSFFFFSSRRRHTRSDRDWSSDVCSSDLATPGRVPPANGDGGASGRARALPAQSLLGEAIELGIEPPDSVAFGDAADALHEGGRPQVRAFLGTERPHAVEGARHDLLQPCRDLALAPEVVLETLDPLEIRDDDAAGVREDVGDHRHPAIAQDRVGLRGRRPVRPLRDDRCLDAIGVVLPDLIADGGRHQDVAGLLEELGVRDGFGAGEPRD